jgi:16S rRNA processing protein RimM
MNLVALGRIIGCFGVKGWIKIKPDTSDLRSIAKFKELYVIDSGNNKQLYTVGENFIRSEIIHLKFLEINDRDSAQKLKGADVAVMRDKLPKTNSDEYYWVDLIGLDVYNTNEQLLGKVDHLIETGPSSVMVLKSDNSIQCMVPFVANFVIDVDLTHKKIIVDWELDY